MSLGTTLFLRRVKTVLQVTVMLKAVLVFSKFSRSEFRNLSHLKQTVENLIAKGSRTGSKVSKILQGIEPLVVKRDKLIFCLIELYLSLIHI